MLQPRAARLTSGPAVVVRWPILESTVDLDEPESAELSRRIGAAWVQIRRGASMGRLREHLYGAGDDPIELGQMDALDLLARQARWRMSDLAEALRIDPSTATRAVQRLVSSGFAKRCPHDDDGRVVMVEITPAGLDRHTDVNARRGELMAHMLGAFTPDERPLLAEMFDRFAAAVDEFVDLLPKEQEPATTS
jgi:DNA-binding MarR family transcriptional regulator